MKEWRNSVLGESSSGYEMFFFSAGGTFWTWRTPMGVSRLWAGPSEHSTWTVPDKHVSACAAWTRLHRNIPVDLRHRTEGPELSGSTQYILHALFVLSVYLPFLHEQFNYKRKYMHIAIKKEKKGAFRNNKNFLIVESNVINLFFVFIPATAEPNLFF